MQTITFPIKPLPPFRLDLTVWALRRRAENIIDRWDDSTYGRVLALGNQPIGVAVRQTGPMERPVLRVMATGEKLAVGEVESKISALLDRMLGLSIDLTDFYEFAKHDSKLGALAEQFLGLKPPKFPSIFEAIMNGIACQQLSLTAGIRFLDRLARAYGLPLEGEKGTLFSFPTPGNLGRAQIEDLRKLGFNRNKARAMIELASNIVNKNLDLEDLMTVDNETAAHRLDALRGVGRWTAEYVLLRGLGRMNMFPGDDVGGRNNLRLWLGISEPLDYEGVQHVVARFQPYAGFVYFHLLLYRLAQAGEISLGKTAA